MTKLWNKKGRYQNSFIIISGILLFILSLMQIIKPVNVSGPSLFRYVGVIFGVPTLIVSCLALGYEAVCLILKNEKLNRYKPFVFYILLFFLCFFLLEHVILGIIRTFISAAKYSQIPEKTMFWTSVSWLLINKYQDFLNGILVTLSISLLGTIIGLILGLLLAILRIQKVNNEDSELKASLKKFGLGFSKVYIAIFRGTPMMVQAILLYYLVPFAMSEAMNIPMSTMNKIFTWFVSGLITVSLNTTAYLAEVIRGSIEAIDKGQMEASRSLGMTYWQTMFNVILPQALKNAMASVGNEFVINIKDTSVLNVISVIDVYKIASNIQSQTYRFNEPFFIAACIYLVLTFVTTRLLALIDKSMDVKAKPLPSSN